MAVIIYDRPAPPSFACSHFEVGGVAAAVCDMCGLLAPRAPWFHRTVTETAE